MIITKVEIKDRKVKILLDEGTSFNITLETYLENSILIGEEISREKINKLVKNDDKYIAKFELINKISRKRLSKKECIEFLKQYDTNEKLIEEIIKELEKNYLINDKELSEFIIDYSLMKKKGINVIKRNLLSRGLDVNDSFIEDYIDREKYDSNILYLLEKYKKMGKNKSNKILKDFLLNKMIENGYIKEEFIDLIKLENNNEKEIITKEINKIVRNNDIDEEIIAKITKKLLSKGFNYGIIKEAIRSVVENEIN